MVDLKLTDDEAKMLLNLIQNYMPELEVEIHRTEEHEFREALEEKERFLREMARRLGEQRKVA
jgi:predicted RNA binding protein with dsRBD fold (UPF0201 family)